LEENPLLLLRSEEWGRNKYLWNEDNSNSPIKTVKVVKSVVMKPKEAVNLQIIIPTP